MTNPMGRSSPLHYAIPEGITAVSAGGQPALQYPSGGRIAVDTWVSNLWELANGKALPEIQELSQDPPDLVRAGLACLSEAGLLSRGKHPSPTGPLRPAAPVSGGLVSVVIVAYEGTTWLKDCLPSLAAQTYSPIETIIYDNASPSHEMQTWVTEAFPQVRYLRGEKPISFASANNLAIQRAQGEYLLLLNQDIRLDPSSVAELVQTAKAYPDCGAVAAKLRFWWAPHFLNGLGNVVRDHSWGMDLGFGSLDLGQFDRLERLPSACFAAALIPRATWEQVGPIDPGFPMYYEDSEWCYRARALGFQVYAASAAQVYHAFGGRVPSGETGGLTARKQANACYGRLRFTLKLLNPPTRSHYLGNYLLEDLRNFLARVARLQARQALAYPRAYLKLLMDLREIYREHKALNSRVRSAVDITTLQFEPPSPLERNGLPLLTRSVIEDTYLPLFLMKGTRPMPEFSTETRRTNLLLVSNDIVDTKMAGPGARYLEMARALSDSLEVTLAIPNETNLQIPGVRILTYQEDRAESLQVLVQNHEQVLISGYMLLKFPFLKDTRTRLIVDWYDPFYLENFYYYLDRPLEEQNEHNATAISMVNDLAKVGDFFICGNERQRDLWIGILSANRRINPLTLKDDETLRKLIDVVGVGIPERSPNPRPMLKGVRPEFPPDCRIILWGGGIWNWLDPISLVQAWPEVINARPDARLVFLGTRHPNPNVPKHEIVDRLIQAAEDTGEKDRTIFFIEWLSYEDREALLLEADIGVTLHPIHAETRYSIRTRVLDYFWARLPVCITEGDVTSEWVETYQVGHAAPPADSNALAEILVAMLAREKSAYAQGFETLHDRLAWEKVVEPLRRFALEGRNAPDRERFLRTMHMDPAIPEEIIQGTLKRAAYIWATKGTKAMLDQTLYHIKFLLGRR